MKKLIAVSLIAILGVVFVSGCVSSETQNMYQQQWRLANGNVVFCKDSAVWVCGLNLYDCNNLTDNTDVDYYCTQGSGRIK